MYTDAGEPISGQSHQIFAVGVFPCFSNVLAIVADVLKSDFTLPSLISVRQVINVLAQALNLVWSTLSRSKVISTRQ